MQKLSLCSIPEEFEEKVAQDMAGGLGENLTN
jgi:hypothetical protein